jgi:cell division protein FtsB
MRPPRVLAILLASVALVGVLFLFVLPGRAYLAQRRTLTAAETRVNVLAKANSQLHDQISKLQTDAEVERLARERYGLIKPGESPYVILPSQPSKAPASTATPAKKSHPGLPARLWRDVQFWN